MTPYLRENTDYGPSMTKFEVIALNDLGHPHVAFASDIKEFCEDYLNNL